MPNPPTPRTWVDGEIPPYSTIQADVYNTISWLMQPPMIKLRHTFTAGGYSEIPHAVWTAIKFNQEDVDTFNWHNSTTLPTRITPTFPGWYRGWFSIYFLGTTGGNFRAGYLAKNGGTYGRSRRDARPAVTAGNATYLRAVPFYVPMNGTTDYVEVMAIQDSGAALVIANAASTQYPDTEFFMRWAAPLNGPS